MKKAKFNETGIRTALIFLIFVSCRHPANQDEMLVGKWYGAVNNDVHIYYEIKRKWDGSLTGFTGIPEFGISGQPVESILLKGDSVLIEEIESNQRFRGVIKIDSMLIRGSYTNLNIGASWPLTIRLTDSVPQPPRPQTPYPPFPYTQEEVVYRNDSEDIYIAGTLTLPDRKGPFTSVLLISGTGQQNRDDESQFHLPFKVIADYLTRNGIAVLRVDDRGIGGTTRKGSFFSSTTKDFESDVLAGVRYLKKRKEIDPGRIGLIGHSEGGLIAAMASADEPGIAFIVLLGSPGSGDPVTGMVEQDSVGAVSRGATNNETTLMMKWCKRFYQTVVDEKDTETSRKKLEQLYADRTPEEKKAFEKTGLGGGSLDIGYASTPHFRYFLSVNTGDFLRHVKCPVLALMGEKDLSGPVNPTLKSIERALGEGGNNRYRVAEIKNVNHSFRIVNDDNSGAEETFSPEVLDLISNWILEETTY